MGSPSRLLDAIFIDPIDYTVTATKRCCACRYPARPGFTRCGRCLFLQKIRQACKRHHLPWMLYQRGRHATHRP